MNRNLPTTFIIFGATGDLVQRKIFPSIYSLYKENKLPKIFNIIGISRRDLNQDEFVKNVSEITKTKDKNFLNYFKYLKGDFNQKDIYKTLSLILGESDNDFGVCANKLFYLATPPVYYETIFNNLSHSGLTIPCSDNQGWTRVLVEKPFGNDYKTAKKLDKLLSSLFKEEQIYRIDHYLGKEALQNILMFRFSNSIFNESWNSKFIEKITVKILEKGDVAKRGDYYDGTGALVDVGQNHLLQMLALSTMDNPGSFDCGNIRKERGKILQNLKKLNTEEIKHSTFRAQYKSYKNTKGVSANSNTETYFKIKAYLDHPKWSGVPICLEAGKALGVQKKEVVIDFKKPISCLCSPFLKENYHNRVIFRIEPKEEIVFDLWVKKRGQKLDAKKQRFELLFKNKKSDLQYIEEYKKLLLDAIEGDQTSFITTEEVSHMWSFIDPIREAWESDLVRLEPYQKGKNDIRDLAKNYLEKNFEKNDSLKKEIVIIGLGKMGANLARNLIDHNWIVYGYNRTFEIAKNMEKEGILALKNLEEIKKIKSPKIVWLMLPSEVVLENVKILSEILQKGDILIDGGNSYYKNDLENHKILKKKGIDYLDVGVSGGPDGARNGACLMVGGNKKLFEHLAYLFNDLATPGGVEHFDGIGAGHFVKMVHNAIEYGMMQSIAEGFDLLKNSDYKFHLKNIAQVYEHGSVIESRLVSWMRNAFEIFGNDLNSVSGKALESGEAKWAILEAHDKNISFDVIQKSLNARLDSQKEPNFQGKIVSALRNQFGKHAI